MLLTRSSGPPILLLSTKNRKSSQHYSGRFLGRYMYVQKPLSSLGPFTQSNRNKEFLVPGFDFVQSVGLSYTADQECGGSGGKNDLYYILLRSALSLRMRLTNSHLTNRPHCFRVFTCIPMSLTWKGSKCNVIF